MNLSPVRRGEALLQTQTVLVPARLVLWRKLELVFDPEITKCGREKTEQSILVDNEWLDTETIAIFRTWNQVLKKNNLRSLKWTS